MRRHGGRIKSAQPRRRGCLFPPPPRSLLDRSTAPRSAPFPSRHVLREQEDDAPRRRRRARVVVFVSGGRPEMMDEGPADLRELVRLPDVLVVCSSRGWTDEKHMIYLQLLEETFVSQLHDSERSFKGLFNLSPRYCGRVKSAKQIVEYAKPDQGCCGIVDADKVNTSLKVELMDSPSSCGNQQDGKVHSMDDNASTTEPVEEAISQARGKHRHSPSRSAEGSDQNFDEETKGIGESRRGCSQKRLKSHKVMRDDQVALSAKAECQKGGLIASNKPEDKYNGTSKVDAGSLDAEARCPMCKNDGSKG